MTDQTVQVLTEILGTFQLICKLFQRFGNDGIKNDIDAGDGKSGTGAAELKLVTGERKG